MISAWQRLLSMACLSLEIDGVDDEEDVMRKEVGRSSEKLLRSYRMKTVILGSQSEALVHCGLLVCERR